MRMGARTNSESAAAREDSPALGERIEAWKQRAAETDWTPWLIVALGAFLRIFLLGIKPPHFDEGINGWFVDQMVKNGFYNYDPTNYHGPLHFYILFLSQTLLGRNLWALRLPVVLGSIFCIRLATKFEPVVGRNTSLLAALAMSVSPGFVFYGRYAIHEVWLLLFSMLFVLGLLGLWKYGTRGYLWCVCMGLAGMILTKETYIIHVGCALLAIPIAWVSYRLKPTDDGQIAPQTWRYVDLALAILVGIAAIIFFYSGTFLHWNGLKGLYQTFGAWFKTGHNGNGHEKPYYYWLMLVARYEWPVLFGLIFCSCCQFFRSLPVRYLAIMGVGCLTAYSIVHYKTPWCIISVVWPLLFVFGAILSLVPPFYQQVSRVACGVLLACSLLVTIWLNYFHCTTESEPYVYVQTYNDIFKLTDPLLKLAHSNPTYYQLVGHMIRTSAYPIPWMLGDFPRVGYYEHDNLPTTLDADFLLVQQDKIADVESKLHGSYYTEPLTIRQYQDPSKLYFSSKVFARFFQGRVPDFAGKPTQ